jgi:hypothetical protein
MTQNPIEKNKSLNRICLIKVLYADKSAKPATYDAIIRANGKLTGDELRQLHNPVQTAAEQEAKLQKQIKIARDSGQRYLNGKQRKRFAKLEAKLAKRLADTEQEEQTAAIARWQD